MRLFPACLILLLSGPAVAQSFETFIDREQFFSVALPGKPTIENIRYEHLDGEMMPARRYSAQRGDGRFVVTVVDMTGLDNVSRVRGSIAHETWNIRKRVRARGGEIIYDAYSQISRIEGHQIQATYPDNSASSWQLLVRDKRLYIQEATLPPGAPPPGVFLASLWILDKDGNLRRPEIDFNGQYVDDATVPPESEN